MSQTFEKQIAGGHGILAANLSEEDIIEYRFYWTFGYNVVMAQNLTPAQIRELNDLHVKVARKLGLPVNVSGLVQPASRFKPKPKPVYQPDSDSEDDA